MTASKVFVDNFIGRKPNANQTIRVLDDGVRMWVIFRARLWGQKNRTSIKERLLVNRKRRIRCRNDNFYCTKGCTGNEAEKGHRY